MPSGLPDIHRHLDGSLRPSTLSELADRYGVSVPSDLHFQPGMGLDEALDRFVFSLMLMQEPYTVKRVAREACEDAEAEGVTTLELRFAPQLHLGGDIPEIVDAALDGIDGRAGLVLCVLYGDEPELADQLVEIGAQRPGVVGIDLAGGPASDHEWSLVDYAPAFRKARSLGLGRTVHAGEGRPPAEIWQAIEMLGAQRIGHGTTLLESEAVLRLVVERQIVIEACPTSNWHTGVIDSIEQHPLPTWLQAGVRVCINTDNTLFSDTNAHEEHRRAASIPGMSPARLKRVVGHGHAAAFER